MTMLLLWLVSIFTLLAAVEIVHRVAFEACAAPSPFNPRSSFRRGTSRPDKPKNPKETEKKWSSMMMVDPAKILSMLIERAGLFIPESVEKELDVLRAVFHCQEAKLNMVERHLILYNFTIAMPKGKPSLRVGRVYIYWDSYLKPCLDIEVDEVDIMVEFTNLLLTRNNWNELKALGLPPKLLLADLVEDVLPSTLVRVNSIDLSSNITVILSSRPLNKQLGVLAVDMNVTDDLNMQIQGLSDANLVRTGRRGITSMELAHLLEAYFGSKVKSFLSNSLRDIATNPEAVIQNADRFLNKAGDSILDYAGDIGQATSKDIQQAIVTKLNKWGIGAPADQCFESTIGGSPGSGEPNDYDEDIQ
jgi:hypothetical protein